MNGVHDMGGMDGFGKVEVEKNEPPFHEPWEGRVLAMNRAMGATGNWNIDMSRHARELLAPPVYLAATYYQKWFLGLRNMLVAARLRRCRRDRGRPRVAPRQTAEARPCSA